MIKESRTEVISISMLRMHPKNIEIYGEEDVTALKQSIAESGWIKPLTVTPDHVIISGHRRYQAALQLGCTEIPIEIEHFPSEEAEMERLLRENENRGKTPEQQIREGMTWETVEGVKGRQGRPSKDEDEGKHENIFMFSGLSRDIIARRVGLGSGVTYEKGKVVVEHIDEELRCGDPRERGRLLRLKLNEESINAASKLLLNYEQIDKQEEGRLRLEEEERHKREEEERHRQEEIIKKGNALLPRGVTPGSLWRLGTHLLYCGDSASQDFIDLCKRKNVSFAFADPPYNAGVAEWDVEFKWQHDYLSEIAPIVAVTPGISAIKDFMRLTSMPYNWSMAYWIDNGMTRGALGFGNWMYVALFSQQSLYRNTQDIKIIQPDSERVSITGGDHDTFKHKGRKPLSFLTHIISLFTEENQIVVDPFLGTGTSIIACEREGRTCIGAEINTEYCEHIIKRWAVETGQEAEVMQC
ncbi:MAG: hypothetical protein PVS3B3_18930 [Ktedonobacteraceae bacterium]